MDTPPPPSSTPDLTIDGISIETSETPHKQPKWMEPSKKEHKSHKIRNLSKTNVGDLLNLEYSVLPKVLPISFGLAVWSALACVFYLVPACNFLKQWGLPNSTLLVTILGSAMGLLLVFRVNTAYDRYWEGRKIWSSVHFQIRNLARLIWTYSQPKNHDEALRRIAAMNLLIAFATSTKHALRNEPDYRFSDVGPFLQHITSYSEIPSHTQELLPTPLEITLHLQRYLIPSHSNHTHPHAYQIHLKQILLMYLVSLPFQLVASPLGWWTIPVVFVSSIIMLGIEEIGGEIENPFGYDYNDLPQDEYCTAIRDEVLRIMQKDDACEDIKGWCSPYPIVMERVSVRKKSHMASMPTVVEEKKGNEDGWKQDVRCVLNSFIKIVS
ncbi:UPF0187-domain-containing protein [Rhizoclosmatium globosum]|uniref:UPF0187-domain-containing protein n=1 Tax=Rhizoclosmatium globosum TaxID=329046 RepID=A0A1Y2CIQ2_9FUNG|nr:UPF0187-domain-containing protein [Rhizoclosmatium globosum]|eukprot:ORY46923.1 UPF0187-domain-containing protein [Rhizoclosmatium globosum]